MYINNKLRVFAVVCALGVAASAFALQSDRNQPVHIQADRGDFLNNTQTNRGTGTYTGHVIITQGSIKITADKAILHMQNGELQTADITGTPATFQQQPDSGALVHGSASHITYDQGKNEVDLSGGAKLTQGARLLTAEVIHYNTATEHVIAQGGANGGRVHITIPPKSATHVNPSS